ncbi:MAG: transposase [Dehalococcoidia bacterium]
MSDGADAEPRAYFITFTTYGSRLHGDARGSVDEWHNRYGEPPMERRPGLEAYERGRLKSAPVTLDASMRGAVEDAIRERCQFMEWSLVALNVRTNHVHVVVFATEPPERVMTSFKARSTTTMRQRGLIGTESRVWTRHGSTRRIGNERDLEAVVTYVMEGQGPDLPRR